MVAVIASPEPSRASLATQSADPLDCRLRLTALSLVDLFHVWNPHQCFSKSDLVSELSKSCFDSSERRRFLLSSDCAGRTCFSVGASRRSLSTRGHSGPWPAPAPATGEPVRGRHRMPRWHRLRKRSRQNSITPAPRHEKDTSASTRTDTLITRDAENDKGEISHVDGQHKGEVKEEMDHTAEDTGCTTTENGGAATDDAPLAVEVNVKTSVRAPSVAAFTLSPIMEPSCSSAVLSSSFSLTASAKSRPLHKGQWRLRWVLCLASFCHRG